MNAPKKRHTLKFLRDLQQNGYVSSRGKIFDAALVDHEVHRKLANQKEKRERVRPGWGWARAR